MLNERIFILASQHHSSEYNRSKFGIHGCPVRYLPLSIHLPEEFNQLRQRQFINAKQRSWWPSQDFFGPPTDSTASVDLRDEIMAAISEPLSPLTSLTCNNPPLKTSISHPINISMIIPIDLVALVSSHALLSFTDQFPTMLEIPSAFTLDKLSGFRNSKSHAFQSTSTGPVLQTRFHQFKTRSYITNALEAAINSGIGKDTVVSGHPIPAPDVDTQPVPMEVFSKQIRPQPLYMLAHVSKTRSLSRGDFSQSLHSPSSFVIGNLFLSSCPGKKVRLDGPIKGRSGVCRDIAADMKRMKELGVACIICCLDDEELSLLGAPWSEYEHTAKIIGMDVLRLPIPEGLPPLSPESLDRHLVDLIRRYTLRGTPVLVHCRGGVGRAGLVACCWMIRLGLCGWISPEVDHCTEPDTEKQGSAAFEDGTLLFVEKVISIIRRRRSMKAIETYEQVQFLVDYVNFLRKSSRSDGGTWILST